MADKYSPKDIETKWQKHWEEKSVYKADEKGKKFYVLDMFPYPSGAGLHVGHPKGYIATDVYSRHKRMQGHDVLHPMGWDAFGLPAEQFAIKNKIHPKKAVDQNVARYKEQLSKIGLDYDWEREINTTDPEYYKWTQWIFLQLYKKGLAYESYAPINWCPSCQTGLANEDLEGGKCERCGSEVEQKPMRQWVLNITAYADRMLEDLELLPNWPEHIKEMQRHWIGRSEGAELEFQIQGREEKISVFTTRADTLYGVTFLVLAPEHPLIELLKDEITNVKEVASYVTKAKNKSPLERQESTEKTGICLEGVTALNPATNEEVPIFVADYVLMNYGKGAIMGVPAHDERDFEFARAHKLPITQVVMPDVSDGKNPPREGKENTERKVVHVIVKNDKGEVLLSFLKGDEWGDNKPITFIIGGIEEGETPEEAAAREILEETGYNDVSFVEEIPLEVEACFFQAKKDVNRRVHTRTLVFKLNSTSQTPISEEEKQIHDFKWIKESEVASLLNIPDDAATWKYHYEGAYVCPVEGTLINSGEFSGLTSEEAASKIIEKVGGKKTVTYRLQDWVFSRQRYWGEPIPLIHCETCGVVPVKEDALPVKLPDVEHYEPTGSGESPLAAIEDWVTVECPECKGKGRRETNTMPQWAGSCWYYLRFMDPHNKQELVGKDKEKFWAPVDVYVGGAEHATRHLIYARFWHKFLYDIGVVSTKEPFMELHSVGLILAEDGRKMSKRFNNVVNPDDVIDEWGADTFRVYEMFMGPFKDTIAWSTKSLSGPRRFIEKVWHLTDRVEEVSLDEETERLMHQTIKKVGEDITSFGFNTAISSLMIYTNKLHELEKVPKVAYENLILLLAPFAPHMAEELWEKLGHTESLQKGPWPVFDESKLVADTVTLIVQVNGKKKGEIEVARDATEDEVVKKAKEELEKHLEGEVKRVVYVPNRILNFII